MLEEKLEIKEHKNKIRFFVGLVRLHYSVKEIASLYQKKKDAFFLAMRMYFRAFKVQKKYLRNRLKWGPTMDARSQNVARESLNFVVFSMHGLIEDKARPKILEFLQDRLAKQQLKEKFGIVYNKSNFSTLLTL